MSVVCAVCHTENRDNAMFCRGCAGKLPSFAPTGPPALEARHVLQPTDVTTARIASPAPPAMPGAAPGARAFWIRFCLLMLALFVGFVAWYAYVTRTMPAPLTAAAASTTLAELPAPPPASARARARATSVSSAETAATTRPLIDPEPVEELLLRVPGSVQPQWIEAPEAREAPAPIAPPLAPEPAAQQLGPQFTPTRRRATATADPRPACASLNFILRAHCEAAQCAKPAYTRHPYCDSVRAQTRRDEAKRNPTQG